MKTRAKDVSSLSGFFYCFIYLVHATEGYGNYTSKNFDGEEI